MLKSGEPKFDFLPDSNKMILLVEPDGYLVEPETLLLLES